MSQSHPRSSTSMSAKPDSGRTYHTHCTGEALVTVQAHEQDEDITLFGSCFCPFVQRVWMVFEILGIPYKAWNGYTLIFAQLISCFYSFRSTVSPF